MDASSINKDKQKKKEKGIEKETLGIFTLQEPFAVLGAQSVSVYDAFTLRRTVVSFTRTVSASVRKVIFQSDQELFGCHQ